MTRKRKPAVFILLLVGFLVATVRTQELLAFGPRDLPACAYGCQELYSAQYECPPEANRVDCFCDASFITSKPEGWGCDEACTVKADRDRVVKFLVTTCGDSDDGEDDGQTKNEKDTPDGNKNSHSTATENKKDPQVEKATNWWRKNWPYFFLAFMLIAITVLILAVAGPVRKYVRRQIIRRRTQKSSKGIPPYWVPSAPATKVPSAYPRPYSKSVSTQSHGYSYGRAESKGTLPQREGGLAYLNSGGLGSYSVVGTPSDPGPHSSNPSLTPPPGPEIRTLFAANAAVSTRQESWERRIREQYNKRGWFSRNLFWRKSDGKENEPEKQHMAVDSTIGRAV